MIRHSLFGAVLALATLSLTGCTDSASTEESAAPAPAAPEAIPAPEQGAKELSAKLADLSARIHRADNTLARLVAVTATDSAERAAAFDKAATAVGTDTVTALATELKSTSVKIAEAWETTIAEANDPASRRRAMNARDAAAAHFAALDKALKGADAAFLQLAYKLRQVRNATGLHPSAAEIIRARPLATQVSESVKTLDGWIRYTDSVLKEIAKVTVPEVRPEPAVVAPTVEAPAPDAETKPAAVTQAAKEVETAPAEVEPSPGNAADPVPEPVDA